MTEWQQQEQPQETPMKSVEEILASLLGQLNEANVNFALGVTQHDEWAAEMRLIDQKLAIFGFRLDRPERFAQAIGRRS